ncbi:MAG: lasso peptide biosynthesis PqqD family chaperone [Nostocaceae cyanobacterium]|nr:lasso peptide biosynthesis PqqD family chaperone [Nostocaceae cyanobacterium]
MTNSTYQSTISKHSIVVASKEQVSSNLSGDAIILDMKSGTYYGLDEVGASIWSLIQRPKTVEEIKNAMLAEYEVEPEECEQGILSLLEDLATQGLIDVISA